MIEAFEARILGLIDDMVEHASDDELFASGYLRGHLTLAIAEVEQGDDHSFERVYQHVGQSLETAINAGSCHHQTRYWFWICGTNCGTRPKHNPLNPA